MTKEIKIITGGMYSGFVEFPVIETPKPKKEKPKEVKESTEVEDYWDKNNIGA